MTKRRINISIIIMLLAIVAIAAFQLYWLRKTFVEEKENLSFRTNVLFREAMQHVQADKLHLDTNVNFKFRTRYNAAGTLDVMRRRALGDSMRRKKVMAGTEIVLQKRQGACCSRFSSRKARTRFASYHPCLEFAGSQWWW